MRHTLAVGLLLVTCALPVSAEQPSSKAPKGRRNPYSTLFQVTPQVPKPAKPQAPRVVCGMTLIPADPSIDPKMMVQLAPPNKNTRYTIRAVEPPVCK